MIAVAAIAVLAMLAWAILFSTSSAPEPVYKGKPLSYWLEPYAYSIFQRKVSTETIPSREEADTALRQIGTNAIPTLLRMLRAHDSPLKIKFLQLTYRAPYFPIHYKPASIINVQAMQAFHVLGPDASCAIPDLVKILDQNISQSSYFHTAAILASFGPEAKMAVPSLLRAAMNTNQPMRFAAESALRQIDLETYARVITNNIQAPMPYQ
ncbi:MAG TPA: hypothetical protein VN048_18885 [Verrucomicrobiae bacterium]|nr:hypothetical protein [Verrucomicrobiae bacterium]